MKQIFALLCSSLLFSTFPLSAIEMEVKNPREKLLLLMAGEWVSKGIYVATKLELADHLQKGPKTIEELAELTHSHPASLQRLMHMLSGFGVFEELSEQVYANTEASLLLGKNRPDSLHALSLFYGEDISQSMKELLQCVHTNTPAFQLTFQQPVFHYFKEHPARASLFQEAMKEKSMAVIQSALSAYDFSRFKTVYDIGGGHGQFLKALTQYYPKVNGLLFELPEVIRSLEKRGEEFLRSKLTAGNFFEEVPKGGDAYILKSVLHDWDDMQAEKILSNCYQAMHPESKLLLVEVVLQPKDQSLYANCMDVLMLAITGGKERTLSSFTEMLEKTGFVLEKVYPTGTEFSILEARKKS